MSIQFTVQRAFLCICFLCLLIFQYNCSRLYHLLCFILLSSPHLSFNSFYDISNHSLFYDSWWPFAPSGIFPLSLSFSFLSLNMLDKIAYFGLFSGSVLFYSSGNSEFSIKRMCYFTSWHNWNHIYSKKIGKTFIGWIRRSYSWPLKFWGINCNSFY